ncbi:MAG TPA: PP0621 family protein [Burkholderiales bacterium]|jgi:uncharacterized protein
MKILFIIVLIAVAIAWLRARARAEEGAAQAAQRPAGQAEPERMVSCAQCGLHLPASEAVFDAGGVAYCGAPHLQAARASR